MDALEKKEGRLANIKRMAELKEGEPWRVNFISAAAKARKMGINPKEKKLVDLVAEIDDKESKKGELEVSAPGAAPAAAPDVDYSSITRSAREREFENALAMSAAKPESEARRALVVQAQARLDELGIKPAATPHPESFITAPDGSIDFGEITPEMAKGMRRQAGKIRLQQGDDKAGLVHIERRHGKEFTEAGYQTADDFVSEVAKGFGEIRKGSGSTIILARRLEKNKIAYVELQPDDDGDFYTVRSATFAESRYLNNKELLWEGAPSLHSHQETPNAYSGQSLTQTIPTPGTEVKIREASTADRPRAETTTAPSETARQAPKPQQDDSESPFFKQGDRVVLDDGRHATVSDVVTYKKALMRMSRQGVTPVPIYEHAYTIKTDDGKEDFGFFSKMNLVEDVRRQVRHRAVFDGDTANANIEATPINPESTKESTQKQGSALGENISPKSPTPSYGENNKLVSAERAEELRRRLRAKLNNINSGIDPELLSLGTELAAFHIEAGARSFVKFSRAMVADLGEKAKPFLKAWYMGAKNWPGMDRTGMDSETTLDALNVDDVVEGVIDNGGGRADNTSKADNQQEADNGHRPEDRTMAAGSAALDAPKDGSQAQDDSAGDRGPSGVVGGTDEGRRAGALHPDEGKSDDGGVRLDGQRDNVGDGDKTDVRPATHGTSGDAQQQDSPGVGNRNGKPSGVSDHRIERGGLKREGSWRETAARNLDIIELVKRLEAEKRQATPEERKLLAKYTGFGASELANNLFPGYAEYGEIVSYRVKPEWKELVARVQQVLTPEELKTAARSTQYAHYTSEAVIRSIYSALERFGFTGGKVLEPGAGPGAFWGLMPDGMHSRSGYTAIEMDILTAAIAKHLYPKQNILQGDYTKQALPNNLFDLGIGNPPFAATVIMADPAYKKHRFKLHDYFFAKTIDKVRPGGLLVFISSHYTMDKVDAKARNYLADRADLLGAIRLPQTAFQQNAGTEVVTDVLFFRKRAEGEQPGGHPWATLAEVSTPEGPAMINEYFVANPAMVLGRHSLQGSMYKANDYTVLPLDGDIESHFAAAVNNLPENVYSMVKARPAEQQAIVVERDFNPKNKKEGGIYLNDNGVLMEVEHGAGKALDAKLSTKDQVWLKGYIELRDAMKQAQYDQLNDLDWEASLKKVNKIYDRFVKQHGFIQGHTLSERTRINEDGEEIPTVIKRYKNRRLYILDVERSLVTAMEEELEGGKIKKAAFLLGRTIKKPERQQPKTLNDALTMSLDEKGRLDLDHIASTLGINRVEVIAGLDDQIFEDHSQPGEWQTRDEYLSGNVVKKLAEAEVAAKADKRFARNVDALQQVQPAPLSASDVTVSMGAPWVPEEVLSTFTDEVLESRMTVRYSPTTNSWTVATSGRGTNRRSGRAIISDWGTDDRSPSEILDAVLNNRTLVIRRTDKDGDSTRTYTDAPATAAVNDIARRMKERFSSWVWQDADRAGMLLEEYNRRYNNLAPRKFDGSHLTLPGVSLRFKLHDHQKAAIWRAIQTGNAYFAHAVGAGKTIEMIAAGMEMRRMGLVQKPMYVVPKHMLQQFSNEFQELYPLAHIMVADEEKFHTDNRRRFMAQAALNNPDAIIITHPSLMKLAVTEESIAPVREAMIADLRMTIADMRDDNAQVNRILIKKMEARVEQLGQMFDSLTGGTKDRAITFEEMGVDYLFVDEAHEFRKLDFVTNRQAKGIDSNGSKKTLDLYIKTKILETKRPGRSHVFASGTPVTNTMGEIYSVMRFFMEEQMETDGIRHFDAWAAMFGEIAPGFERNAAGNYEMVERFAKFMNVPELMSRARSFMDVLTFSNLGAAVKRPDIEGGTPKMVLAPQGPAMRAYLKGALAERIRISKEWRPSKEEPGNPDPIINIITDGRLASIDMRFVNPAAPNDPDSKLNKMIDGIIETWRDTKDTPYNNQDGSKGLPGAAQIVFYNHGFGAGIKKNRGFDARAWVMHRLRGAGIPAKEVAWIGDYNTAAKKEAMFEQVRQGQVRILIGSAKKMGTGVNVQHRMHTLHYLDAPWYPSDVEQPHGRILRQGNQNDTARIFWYASEGSYDSTMWQMVARKAKFIEQALSGDNTVRTLTDISEVSSYEMATALSSGDQRVIQLAGLKSDLERLNRLKQAHHAEQISLRSKLRENKYRHQYTERRAKEFAAAAAMVPDYIREATGEVDGKKYDERSDLGAAMQAKHQAIVQENFEKGRVGRFEVGKVNGFTIAVDVGKVGQEQPMILAVTKEVHITIDPDGAPAGLVSRILNQLNGLSRKQQELEKEISELAGGRAKIEKRIGAPFEYEQELNSKTAEAATMEAELLTEGREQENSGQPSVVQPISEDVLAAIGEGVEAEQAAAKFSMDSVDSSRPSSSIPVLSDALKSHWGTTWDKLVARGKASKKGGIILVQTEQEAIDRLAKARMEAGLALTLEQARRQLGFAVKKSAASRTTSPANYPVSLGNVIKTTTLAKLKSHADYEAAKRGGDIDAARRLVADIVTPKLIADIKARLKPGEKIYFVPVIHKEGPHLNMIPLAYAQHLVQELGGEFWYAVGKESGRHNTGATQAERFSNVQTFSGKAPSGGQIVLVDDNHTSGDTFASLIDKLAANGNMPMAATTLSASRYQNWLAAPAGKIAAMLDKAGMDAIEFEHEFGYPPEHLTGSEAQAYILTGGKGRDGLKRLFPARRGAASVSQNGHDRLAERRDDDASQEVKPLLSTNGKPQAIYDPATGLAAIIADNTSVANAPGVVAHEIGVHARPNEELDQRAANLYRLQRESPFMKAVAARMKTAELKISDATNEELRAYIVEESINRGREAGHSVIDEGFWVWANDNLPKGVVSFLKDVVAWVRGQMLRSGILTSEKLTVDDIVAIAKANVRDVARGKDERIKEYAPSGAWQPLYASEKNKVVPFYSQLRKAIQGAPEKVFAGAGALKLWLNANAAKLGVKQDEIFWSGLYDYLDSAKGNGKLNKAGVLAFMDDNAVLVRDVTLDKKPLDMGDTLAMSDDEYSASLGKTLRHAGNKRLADAAGTDHKELVVLAPGVAKQWNIGDWNHYEDIPNMEGSVVGWLRMWTKTDDKGKKTLVIGELQSKRAEERRKNASIPGAPYVSTSKGSQSTAYITLLMKKAIAYAIETGHQNVVWDDGGIQGERFGLIETIDRIDVNKLSDGTFVVKTFDEMGDEADAEAGLEIEQIAKKYSKEIADGVSAGQKEFKELNLKVGGKWAREMYGDKDGLTPEGKPSLMAQAANDILKKSGGWQVASLNGKPGFTIPLVMREKLLREGFAYFSVQEAAKAFYSRLKNAALEMPDTIKAGKIVSFLKSKLKDTIEERPYQEILAIGLDTWVKAKHPNDDVSKKEIMDFVKANTVELEDVVLGEEEIGDKTIEQRFEDAGLTIETEMGTGDVIVLDSDGEIMEPEELQERHPDLYELAGGYAINNGEERGPTATRFSRYAEPGAVEGSYREMFVTAPNVESGTNGYGLREEGGGLWSYYGPGVSSRLYKSKAEAESALEKEISSEEINGVGVSGWRDGHPSYDSVKNPIVRIRFNEVNADGKRILRIEEAQGPGEENQKKMPSYLRENIYSIAVKRILAYAKENGFDGVALATKPGMTAGETQADRYSLEKQINSISYWDNKGHGRVVDFEDTNGNAHRIGTIDENGTILAGPDKGKLISEFIGKEHANKVLSDKRPKGVIEGIDLRVGGEGLKKLYDTTIPAMLEAYGKGKMESVTIDFALRGETTGLPVSITEDGLRGGWTVNQGTEVWNFPTEVKAEEFATKLRMEIRPVAVAPYLPLENAPASYPMFSQIAKEYGISAEEAVRRYRQISSAKPVNIKDGAVSEDRAWQIYESLTSATNKNDGRRIMFVNSIFGKLARHRQKHQLFRMIPQLPELTSLAVPMFTEAERNPDRHVNIVGYTNYVSKLKMDGKDYYARITVQEVKKPDGNELHSVFVSDVAIIEAGSLNNHSGLTAPDGAPTIRQAASHDSILSRWLTEVKTATTGDIRYSVAPANEDKAAATAINYTHADTDRARAILEKALKTEEKQKATDDDGPMSLKNLEATAKDVGRIIVRKQQKKDFNFVEILLSTPEYYFKKIPAAGRILQLALLRRDVKFQKEHEILGKDFLEYVPKLRKSNKEAYDEGNEYLIETDQTGHGFRIEEADGVWSVFGPDGRLVGKYEKEQDAIKAMILSESVLLEENGYSKEAIHAIKLARELTNRAFNEMAVEMRTIIREAKEAGLPNPLIGDGKIDEAGRWGIYAEGKRKPVALFATEKEASEFMDRAAELVSFTVVTRKGGKRTFNNAIKAAAWARKHSGTVNKEKAFGNLRVKRRTDADLRPLTVQQALANMGDLRGTYFPRQRESGEYVMIAKRPGEKPIRKHFDVPPMASDEKGFVGVLKKTSNWTMAQVGIVFPNAAKEARGLTAKGYEVEFKKDDAPADDVFAATNLMTSIDAILEEAMTVVDKDDPESIKVGQHINKLITLQVADVFKGRGFLSSRMGRIEDVWEGYEKDMGKALTSYAKGVAAGIAKRDTARAMVMAFTGRDYTWEQYKKDVTNWSWAGYQKKVKDRGIDAGKQKEAFALVRQFIVDVLRNESGTDRIIGTFKGLAVQKYLGFRVASAAVNITNMATGVPATIAGHFGISITKAWGYIRAAAVDYGKHRLGKLENEEGEAIFTHISDMGWDDPQFNHEAARELRGKMGEAWNTYITWAMYMFGAVEKANRAMTIYAAYHAAKKKNPEASRDTLLELAKQASDNAHGIYGKETRPTWTQGKLSFLSVPYVFAKFGHNYLLNMWDLGVTRKQYKAAAYLAISPAFLGGAGASLPIAALIAILGAFGIGGDDPEEEFYAVAEKTFGSIGSRVARHGLPGAVGVSIKGSLAMGNPIPKTMEDLFGAPGSVVTDIWKGAGHLARGEVSKGVESIIPTAFGSAMKAVREHQEGVSTGNYGQVFYGNEPLKSDGIEAALRFFSFNPSRLSGIREKQWNEREVADKYQERKSDIYAKIKRLDIQGKGLTPEIMKEIARYNEMAAGAGRVDIRPITKSDIRNMLRRATRPSRFERARAQEMEKEGLQN